MKYASSFPSESSALKSTSNSFPALCLLSCEAHTLRFNSPSIPESHSSVKVVQGIGYGGSLTRKTAIQPSNVNAAGADHIASWDIKGLTQSAIAGG